MTAPAMKVLAEGECYCQGDWLCHHHMPAETRIAVHIAVRETAARLAAAEKRAAEFEALYDNALRQSANLVPRTPRQPSATTPDVLALVDEMERRLQAVRDTQAIANALTLEALPGERVDAWRKRDAARNALHDYCDEHVAALCAAVREAREQSSAAKIVIDDLCDVAHKHGWNGVENSKILVHFFDNALTDAASARKDMPNCYCVECRAARTPGAPSR